MLLSSNARVMQYAGLIDAAGDNPDNSLFINVWLPVVSKRIEQYLNRQLHIEQRTEFFDSIENQIEYYPRATPIICSNSVYASSMGMYNGEEYAVINWYTGRYNESFELNYPVLRWRKGLRYIYYGGMAYSGTQSNFPISGITNSFTVDKYVIGSLSGACGKIVASDSYTITIDNYYGVFVASDVLIQYEDKYGLVPSVSGGSATITFANNQPENVCLSISSNSGAWAVGKYCKGNTSGAIGLIIRTDNSTYIDLSMQSIGTETNFFSQGETLSQYDSSSTISTTTAGSILNTFINSALCESFPEITTACEIELRYMVKHQYDMENQSTMKEQTSRRPDLVKYVLQPESIALLENYKRIIFT
jgi:hypothetical protein